MKPLCILYLPVCGCVPSPLQHSYQIPKLPKLRSLCFWLSRVLELLIISQPQQMAECGHDKPTLQQAAIHQRSCFVALTFPVCGGTSSAAPSAPSPLLLPKRGPQAQSWGWGLNVFPFISSSVSREPSECLQPAHSPIHSAQSLPRAPQKIMGL